MSQVTLIVIMIVMYALIFAEYFYKHRTNRHDLLLDIIRAALPVRVEYNYGPHIFVLGLYFGERSRDLWLCVPFFMMRLIFKSR